MPTTKMTTKRSAAKKATSNKKASSAKSTKKAAQAKKATKPQGSAKGTSGAKPTAQKPKAASNAKPATKAPTEKRRAHNDDDTKELRKSPTTEVTAEVLEFINALNAYKKENNCLFPAHSEILQVLLGLGYRKA
ncbi:MAG TPA: hypothetical protein PKE00_03630 [Planctomycetota bacterium]|nr:hypothetical protein [Planctomycetota bacterium]